jgi:hypothetical protein
MLAIVAGILVARHLKTADDLFGGPQGSPRTDPDEATGIGEWMWLRVQHCDDQKKLVFGTLDTQPLSDYEGKVERGGTRRQLLADSRAQKADRVHEAMTFWLHRGACTDTWRGSKRF